jgi:hypothetical protein
MNKGRYFIKATFDFFQEQTGEKPETQNRTPQKYSKSAIKKLSAEAIL